MKNKVLLFGYSRANFGDDIFIYMLAKRYKEIEFYIHIKEEKYKKGLKELKNVHYLDEDRDVKKIDIEKYDAFCYVGGSIFIESNYARHEAEEFNYFIKKCKEKGKPFFYMTCNFGPYNTEEYLNKVRENFSLCESVCVRDKKTYGLFNDIPTVSYAPDMVLSYPVKKIEKNKKSVGISVINLANREELLAKQAEYEDYIKRIVIKFAKRNYKVYLISFCEFEEDMIAIKKIKNLIPEEYQKNVKILTYEGNIDGFIEEYGKIKYMVCTRFHSLILSILLRQKIYNLCYSDKQKNAAKDYKLFRKVVMIKDINYNIRLKKNYFKSVNWFKYKKLNKLAEGQFKGLENWIKNNSALH